MGTLPDSSTYTTSVRMLKIKEKMTATAAWCCVLSLSLYLSVSYPHCLSLSRARTHTLQGLCVLWLNEKACEDGQWGNDHVSSRCTTDLIQQRDQFHCLFAALFPSFQCASPSFVKPLDFQCCWYWYSWFLLRYNLKTVLVRVILLSLIVLCSGFSSRENPEN